QCSLASEKRAANSLRKRDCLGHTDLRRQERGQGCNKDDGINGAAISQWIKKWIHKHKRSRRDWAWAKEGRKRLYYNLALNRVTEDIRAAEPYGMSEVYCLITSCQICLIEVYYELAISRIEHYGTSR